MNAWQIDLKQDTNDIILYGLQICTNMLHLASKYLRYSSDLIQFLIYTISLFTHCNTVNGLTMVDI